jgi:hypothetical protein
MASLRKQWFSQRSIRIAYDDRLLEAAAASGCRGLFIGLQSLSQDNLAQWNKKTSRAAEFGRALPARDVVPPAGTDREGGDPAQPVVPRAAYGRRHDALTRPAASRR